MRSIFLVLFAATLLVFCGDDEDDKDASVADKPPVSKSGYSLKVSGVGSSVATGTYMHVVAEIMQNSKLVDNGDVATTKATLVIKCGDNQVAEQKDKAATAGKVKFDAIKVEGDNFTGDCKLTVSAKPAGEDVSAERKFKVKKSNVRDLPKCAGSNKPSLPTSIVVGEPFEIESSVEVKVQPNSLCRDKDTSANNLALIHYDTASKLVREVLSAGVALKPTSGKISGLALVQVKSGDLSAICSEGLSVNISVMPCSADGVGIDITAASNPPSLSDVGLSEKGGKIKMNWKRANGFSSGELFFNNVTEGNEWTHYNKTLNLKTDQGGDADSTLDYALPVRALMRAVLSGGAHWLFFKKDS